jgi:hypothetical protein
MTTVDRFAHPAAPAPEPPIIVAQSTVLWTAIYADSAGRYVYDPDSLAPVVAWAIHPVQDGHIAQPITPGGELEFDADRCFAQTVGQVEVEVRGLCERLNRYTDSA